MKYFLATQLASTEHVLNRSEANRFISAHNLTVWTVEPQETTMNVIINWNHVRYIDFRALSDRTRLEILSLLNDGEKCACKLLEKLSISQPTLSHHMKILCDSGLVKSRNEGKWVHYSIDPAGFALAQQFLGQLSRFVVLKAQLPRRIRVDRYAGIGGRLVIYSESNTRHEVAQQYCL